MNISLSSVSKLYSTFVKYPFGKQAFSFAFSLMSPYFFTIRPSVNDMKPGYSSVSMKQRWGVQNHIKTVHAIAVCNLVEMSMGLVTEATIPDHLRWIPMGMDVSYKKKATGRLTATSTIDANTFFTLKTYPGMVKVPVTVVNEDGFVVTTAEVRLWISEKPPSK